MGGAEAAEEDLEAEAMQLRKDSETLKESINKYHDLMDAWNDFVGWAARTNALLTCPREKE